MDPARDFDDLGVIALESEASCVRAQYTVSGIPTKLQLIGLTGLAELDRQQLVAILAEDVCMRDMLQSLNRALDIVVQRQ